MPRPIRLGGELSITWTTWSVILFWETVALFFAPRSLPHPEMSSQNKLQRERNQKQLLELVALPGNSE